MNAPSSALDAVKTAYAAFGRGDIAALLGMIADDAEWKFVGSRGLPYTGTFRGRDAIANWFASIPDVDDILLFEPREFLAAGEHVTVIGFERTRSRPSGNVYETDWVHIFTVHGGRIVRFWGIYDTEASARARA